jgi:LPS export ABC transporter protein LptC
MDKKKKILLALLLVAVAGLVAWAVMTVPAPPQSQVETSDSKVMTYDGNTISEEKDGRKIWELTADHIEVDVDTQNVKMEKVVGHFYMQDGRTVDVQADNGSYDNETKDISIIGSVDITTSDGAKLASDELKWTGKDSMLAAIGNANVSKDDMQANGNRIESTDGFNKIKIIGKAHLVKGGEAK